MRYSSGTSEWDPHVESVGPSPCQKNRSVSHGWGKIHAHGCWVWLLGAATLAVNGGVKALPQLPLQQATTSVGALH